LCYEVSIDYRTYYEVRNIASYEERS